LAPFFSKLLFDFTDSLSREMATRPKAIVNYVGKHAALIVVRSVGMARLACDLCPRRGQYRKETLITRFGGAVLMPGNGRLRSDF
jgi:hypothetical protein